MKDICARKIKDMSNEDYMELLSLLSKSLEEDSSAEIGNALNSKQIVEQWGNVIIHRMSMGHSTLIAILARVIQNQIDMTKKQIALEELVKQIPTMIQTPRQGKDIEQAVKIFTHRKEKGMNKNNE